MNKNFIRVLALSAMLVFGLGSAQAQENYEVPPIDPEHAAMAQQVIDLQLSDPDEANKIFTKLTRKIRNKKEALLSVGQFFLEKNNYPCANQCAKQLETIAADYIPGLMFSGEVCMLRKDYGSAGQKFDQVIALDSTNVAALKRNAFVYKNVNPHVAVEMLQKIKKIEPNNYAADKELGDIAYNLEDYPTAVNHYKGYFTNAPENERSVRAAENYLLSLFSTQKFMEISELVDGFAAMDPKDMVFKRMKFFAAIENYELDKAKEAITYITEKQYPDSLYLYLDYSYAGNYMNESGDIPAAIAFYEQALKVDSTKPGGWKELANLYRRNKQAAEGLSTYQKYLDVQGDKAKLSDWFGFAQQYVAAIQAEADPEKKAALLAAGEKVCANILEKNPEAYQVYLLQANMNITDGSKPEDKVKEYYEKAYQMMEGKEEVAAQNKVQALRYLAFYAVQKDLVDDARKYTDAILALDAENAFAKQIDEYLKGLGK